MTAASEKPPHLWELVPLPQFWLYKNCISHECVNCGSWGKGPAGPPSGVCSVRQRSEDDEQANIQSPVPAEPMGAASAGVAGGGLPGPRGRTAGAGTLPRPDDLKRLQDILGKALGE